MLFPLGQSEDSSQGHRVSDSSGKVLQKLVEAWCRLSLFQTWLAGAGRALSEVRTSWLPDSSQLTFGRRARQGNGFKEITSQERKVAEERSPVLSLTSQAESQSSWHSIHRFPVSGQHCGPAARADAVGNRQPPPQALRRARLMSKWCDPGAQLTSRACVFNIDHTSFDDNCSCLSPPGVAPRTVPHCFCESLEGGSPARSQPVSQLPAPLPLLHPSRPSPDLPDHARALFRIRLTLPALWGTRAEPFLHR
uniref:Uncharacterized protein n=1 Tax=Rangifer tarandus platyrhynchus TaxID=3082113 RepID=A0ACB0EVM4_RANTA|nr:unnamed protein product [Rangifer tarandus platyrhynchus]